MAGQIHFRYSESCIVRFLFAWAWGSYQVAFCVPFCCCTRRESMSVEADVAPCEGLQRGPNGVRSLYQLVIPIIPIPMSVGCAAYCLDKIIIHTVVPNRF